METNSMQWFIDLCEAINDMPEADRLHETKVYNSCPWCRVGLEHTSDEHYLTKPE